MSEVEQLSKLLAMGVDIEAQAVAYMRQFLEIVIESSR
jgi:hypothetical protein